MAKPNYSFEKRQKEIAKKKKKEEKRLKKLGQSTDEVQAEETPVTGAPVTGAIDTPQNSGT